MGSSSGVYSILVIFLFILAVLWILMPFAIFGTKAKLDSLIEQSKINNDKLQVILEELQKK